MHHFECGNVLPLYRVPPQLFRRHERLLRAALQDPVRPLHRLEVVASPRQDGQVEDERRNGSRKELAEDCEVIVSRPSGERDAAEVQPVSAARLTVHHLKPGNVVRHVTLDVDREHSLAEGPLEGRCRPEVGENRGIR